MSLILTPGQAAAQLGLSTYKLRQLIREGIVPAYRVGRALRLKESDVQECMESARVPAKVKDT